MLLQGNLPLEFKESGTLLGRFWRGIRNWEDCFWRRRLKKKRKQNILQEGAAILKKKEVGELRVRKTCIGGGRGRKDKKKRILFFGEWVSDGRKKDSRVPSHCSQVCPGAFSTISYASSYSILDDSLMVLSIYFADWAWILDIQTLLVACCLLLVAV